jgi:Translocon-associated protein (TRAP), alpha subunit
MLLKLIFLLSSILATLSIDQVKDLRHAPQVTLSHDFPKSKSSRLTIDEKVLLRINFTNTSPLTRTIFQVSGYFVDLDDASKVIQKISVDKTQYICKQDKTVNLKYRFTPQLESGKMGLLVLVEYYDSDEEHYKSVGALQHVELGYADATFDLERLSCFFDFSISIYLLLVALLAGSFYWVYGALTATVTPEKKKEKTAKVTKAKTVAKPVEEADLEWIPDHVKVSSARSSARSSPRSSATKK